MSTEDLQCDVTDDRRDPDSPRVGGMVTVDLRHHADLSAYDLGRADMRALELLYAVPDGVHVRVRVGNRRLLTPSGIHELRKAATRLRLTIDTPDAETFTHWRTAISTGQIL